MAKNTPEYGIFTNGIPYCKFGSGKKQMLVLQGGPGNELYKGFTFKTFSKPYIPFCDEYTVYFVSRKSGLPENYTTGDMSNDYATMIKQEFNGKVDVIIGISFGGFIIQHFAADYPEMSDYYIIAMAAYKGSEEGSEFDKVYAKYISEGKTGRAYYTMPTIFIDNRVVRFFVRPFFFFVGLFLEIPENESYPQDVQIESKAGDTHNTKNRLGEINQPILILCGDSDYFMPLPYLREMEQLIPKAILKIYPKKGHNIITSKQYTQDIAEFITKS